MHRPLLAVVLLFSGVLGQVCRNEYGEPVDWFYMYKLPKLQQGNNFLLRKGLYYVYLTSKHDTADWREGLRSLNDTNSIVGRTLSPIYNRTTSSKLFYMLYNDDPPNSTVTLNYAHMKGVIVSDGVQGFWLIHSSPRFPDSPIRIVKQGNNITKLRNKYSYPPSATKFGQSFLCISMNAKNLNEVGSALMYDKPKVYSANAPKPMKDIFPNLTRAAQGDFIKTNVFQYKTTLLSLNNSRFTVYAKTKKFNKDLYADFIAPDIKSNMEVESWMNGPGDIHSDCHRNYSVNNIRAVKLQMTKDTIYNFKNSQDHSKWAVSESDKMIVCVGDINRMDAQLKRGGGSVCFRHPKIWSRYKKAVEELEPCKRIMKTNSTMEIPVNV